MQTQERIRLFDLLTKVELYACYTIESQELLDRVIPVRRRFTAAIEAGGDQLVELLIDIETLAAELPAR